MALIDALLSDRDAVVSTLDGWWEALRGLDGPPFDVAAEIAATSDRLACVFASAYVGALRSLFGVAHDQRVALCVTEDAGNTPSAIETRFDAGRLHGTKSFVTFGDDAEELLVLATRGEDAGRKDLVIVRTTARHAVVANVIQTPFMPEVTHARMVFEDAPAELLFDDAWPLVKGFRYVEDVFVLGATLACLTGLSVRFGPIEQAASLVALVLSLRELAAQDPGSSAAHLAYDGLDAHARRAIDEFDWSGIPSEISAMWMRDKAVLDIASSARRARAELARKAHRRG